MQFSDHHSFVWGVDRLAEWFKVDVAEEKVASWVWGQLIELSHCIPHEERKLRRTDLWKEQVQAHELAHLLFARG